jgi:chromosome segregation ATPase
MWEAHKMTFDNLGKMSIAMRKLFLIGVANSAYTRAIISNLRQKTEMDNLTEDARNELLGVIRDLEAQADVHDKIQRLKERVKEIQESSATLSDIVNINAQITSIMDLNESNLNLINSVKKEIHSNHEKIQADVLNKTQQLKNCITEIQQSNATLTTDIENISIQIAQEKNDIIAQITSIKDLNECNQNLINSVHEKVQSNCTIINQLSIWSDSIAKRLNDLSQISVSIEQFDHTTNEQNNAIANFRNEILAIQTKIEDILGNIENSENAIRQEIAGITDNMSTQQGIISIMERKLNKQKYFIIISNIIAFIAILVAIFE